jgi:hypothetical protein
MEQKTDLPTPLPSEVESRFRKGELFDQYASWKYTVWLDYRGLDWEHWDIHANAAMAFKNATARGLSGVSHGKVHAGWFLIVLDPWAKHSFPIMITGK